MMGRVPIPEGLDKLYFGKDGAESDFAKGGLLKQGFLRTRAFEEAMAGTKTLIIGRKGSGKSAICLMLKDSLSGEERCSLIGPDEISADEIRRFQLPGIPKEQSKQLIWRYVFAVQMAKFLLSTGAKTAEKRADLALELTSIRRFLSDNGELEDLSYIEKFWKVIERLKGSFSIEAFSMKASLEGEMKAPSAGAKANDELDFVESRLNRIARLLGLLDSRRTFHILVDQVDKVWSNDRESDSMVVGLLTAAKDMQSRFDFVTVTVFLRTDIYERLQFHDRDKFRGDEFHIDWSESDLLEMVVARAQASLGVAVDADQIWQQYFPESVELQSCRKFIVSRTLMRPRDIIQFCNACRDMARNSRHVQIEEQDMLKALVIYSNWKLGDLQSEWMVNYPFLPDLCILISNSSYLISRVNFEAMLDQVRADFTGRYPSLGHAYSADTFLSVLYSIGILGVIRHGKTVYVYGQPSERQVRVDDAVFVLHPCFRSALQSTSAIKLSAFEPQTEIERRGARARIARGSFLGHFEALRGPRELRSFQYFSKNLERLRRAVENSGLPEELRVELVKNLAAMQMDISIGEEYSYVDPITAREIMVRQYRHLRLMKDGLKVEDWLEGSSELVYVLSESVEELERFVYRGELGEYDRS